MPKKTRSRSIQQILRSSSPKLEHLVNHAQTLETLNLRLGQLLPFPLAQHCSVAKLDQQTLVLVVDSPAWATRLRMHSPKIIKGLAEFHIQAVNVKTQPAKMHPKRTSKPRPKMSSAASKLLIQLAETTTDSKLKDALRRLSAHVSK